MQLRIGSLCSGYGGLDAAVIDALGGGQVAWHAQYEPPDKDGRPDRHQWAAQILAHHHPDTPNHGDITAIDFRQVEPINVLTAGFPCTDISLAGRRAGLRAGTRSGIWTHVARAIAELRPSLVAIENVRSLTSASADSDMEPCTWCLGDGGDESVLRALGAVLGDLADLGFDAEWTCLRASDVGAPHQRHRIFILARPVADAEDVGHERDGNARHRRPGPEDRGLAVADANHGGLAADGELPARRDPIRGRVRDDAGGLGPAVPTGGGATCDCEAWGPYATAVHRWELILGRGAPSPTEPGPDGSWRLSPRAVEFMMGLPAGWVTNVPGIPRNAQLKALGNGVVPQQGAAAFRILHERLIGCMPERSAAA